MLKLDMQGWDVADLSLDSIAERLKLTRQALGLKQIEFCGRAKIAANTYNQWERAKQRLTLEGGVALCEAHRLTLDWLFRDDPSGLRYDLADAIAKMRRVRKE